ncbi:TPA: hypothetical protein P0E12_004985 [Vibrio harveyi]|nr:hypothetical protein [Vibrio harveyi]
MNGNVMSINTEMKELTDQVYGSNRVIYTPSIFGFCGNEKPHGTGKLKEGNYKQVSWDVAQKFPEDEFAGALKATSTEIAQVHGAPNTFQYCQYPTAVEFIMSNMSDGEDTNIHAGITNNMAKKYDYEAWNGTESNEGVIGNEKAIEQEMTIGDFAKFKEAVAKILRGLREIGIGRRNYSDVRIEYTSDFDDLLTTVPAGSDEPNMSHLEKAFPNVVFVEIQDNNVNDGDSYITGCYKPMITLHRGAVPSVYGQKQGDYGMSTGTLYAYESTSVECEVKGAIQTVFNK